MLALGMVFQNPDEYDEGIDSLGDSWSSQKFSATTRSFQTLEDVIRFCTARMLRRNVAKGNLRYNAVSKALYIEVSELKAFLGHILNHLDEQENIKQVANGPELAKTYVKEWAKLWLHVMKELRRKVRRRSGDETSYEFSPLDIVSLGSNDDLRDISSKRPVESTDSLPNDAEDKIFDFLRARVASQEDLRSSRASSSGSRSVSPDSNIGFNEVALNRSESRYSSVESDTSDEVIPPKSSPRKQTNSPQRSDSFQRKILAVNKPLVEKMQQWDNFDPVEADFLSKANESDEEDVNRRRVSRSDSGRKRVPLSPACIREMSDLQMKGLRSPTKITSTPTFSKDVHGDLEFGIPTLSKEVIQKNNNLFSPSRLSRSELHLDEIDIETDENDNKIGSSLVEIFKIRQEMTRAELEVVRNDDLLNQKICFSCRKIKFSLFQRPKQCGVCHKKFCIKCISENVPVPHHLIDAAPPNINISYNAADLSNLQSSRMFCRSMFSLNNIIEHDHETNRWFSKRHSSGLQLHMCQECLSFLNSIELEKRKVQWKVQLELDL